LSLQSSIEEQLSRWTLEESRADYLARAHQALHRGKYEEAIQLLENCKAEGVFSDEITSLLELAQLEADRQNSQAHQQKLIVRAQELMAKEAFDSVIELLSPVSLQDSEPAVRNLLENARSQRNSLRAKTDSILERLKLLAGQEQYEEALNFAETQASFVSQSPPLQTMLAQIRASHERDAAGIRVIAIAYAALDRSDLGSAWTGIHSGLKNPDSPFLVGMIKVFEGRCRSTANDRIGTAVQASRDCVAEDPRRATEVLRAVSPMAPYASTEVRAAWQSMRRRVMVVSTIRRFGIKTDVSDRSHTL
jgi:tetratricopeptide (TPR) repeat protein